MFGRFATTSYAFERELRDVSKKQPRLKTHSYGQDLITGTTDPSTYARQYYTRLVERLMAQNIATSGFVSTHFRWAVPGPASTATQLATWEMIDRCPMIVSDTELQTVFKMQGSTLQSPEMPEGLHILYLRTWPISPSNLRFLLDRMISQGMFFEEFRAWDNVLSIYEAAAENVAAPERLYIRYIGETEGPKRPIDRQSEDEQGREYGVMSAFLKAVEEFLPNVHRERKVWTLTDGCLSEDSYLSIENNERMAIQLFDPATLINRQRGGFYASYVPSSGDVATFRNMRTDFWARFNSGAGLPSANMQSQLNDHFKHIQQYANDHPAETGTAQVGEFSDQWTEVVQQQATPFQYKGFTIAAWLLKDVTREEYVAKGVFINGKSRAGHLTRDFIHRLVREESLQHRGQFPAGSFNPSRGPWCFVDLWSWPWHRNFAKLKKRTIKQKDDLTPLYGPEPSMGEWYAKKQAADAEELATAKAKSESKEDVAPPTRKGLRRKNVYGGERP